MRIKISAHQAELPALVAFIPALAPQAALWGKVEAGSASWFKIPNPAGELVRVDVELEVSEQA